VPNLPTEVDKLYKKSNHGQQQPGLDDLIKTLISLFQDANRTFLVMDALDECTERKDLLNTIRRIVEIHSVRVNVLVTSREEQKISEGLKEVILDSIGLDCAGIDADIKHHISQCLGNDPDWQNDPSYIKQEIQDALVKGAQGM
jgi:hypothetical protein